MATKKKKEQVKETWNNIAGVCRIYGNEFEGKKNTSFIKWSASLPIKDMEGSIVSNYYIRVKFADDAEEPEKPGLHTIDIEHAFLATDRWAGKDGVAHVELVLVVIENEVID